MDRIEELRARMAALTQDGDGRTLRTPWHAVTSGDPAAWGFWLDNEDGDSSFPDPDDVALFVNSLPLLLDVVEAARPIIDYAKAHEPANRQDFERLEAALAALDSQP